MCKKRSRTCPLEYGIVEGALYSITTAPLSCTSLHPGRHHTPLYGFVQPDFSDYISLVYNFPLAVKLFTLVHFSLGNTPPPRLTETPSGERFAARVNADPPKSALPP